MCSSDLPNIAEVVDLLGLERDPRSKKEDLSFNVKCPFCGNNSKSYKMNINVNKNAYHCFKCSDERGTGVLDLYGRVRLGIPHIKGKDGNGKELLIALLKDLGKYTENYKPDINPTPTTTKQPKRVSQAIAINSHLHQAFSFILHFKHFSLSPQHKANLLKRGLDETTIIRNEYATMPDDTTWNNQYPQMIQLYHQKDFAKEKQKYKRISSISDDKMIAGFILANEMRQANIDLRGIPGAFTLKGFWFFMYEPGLLIPTRNMKQQIVGLQTRFDQGSLRYGTKSASNLPDAVCSDISKAHFPLGNSTLDKNPVVICTEGPLKADVISHLYPNASFLVAVQGVSNTRMLSKIFREFRCLHICKLYNGFDMDKCLNTNVRKQSKALGKKAKDAGLCMSQLCWDEDYATKMWLYLYNLCKKHEIEIGASPMDNIYTQLASMADALKLADIPYCTEQDGKKITHHYWRDETKGLDDYLLFCQQNGLAYPILG